MEKWYINYSLLAIGKDHLLTENGLPLLFETEEQARSHFNQMTSNGKPLSDHHFTIKKIKQKEPIWGTVDSENCIELSLQKTNDSSFLMPRGQYWLEGEYTKLLQNPDEKTIGDLFVEAFSEYDVTYVFTAVWELYFQIKKQNKEIAQFVMTEDAIRIITEEQHVDWIGQRFKNAGIERILEFVCFENGSKTQPIIKVIGDLGAQLMEGRIKKNKEKLERYEYALYEKI